MKFASRRCQARSFIILDGSATVKIVVLLTAQKSSEYTPVQLVMCPARNVDIKASLNDVAAMVEGKRREFTAAH